MRLLLDAQISQHLAPWLSEKFGVDAVSCAKAGLLYASDLEVFNWAKQHVDVVVTKDIDFLRIHEAQGGPPKILWITCGNSSNAFLRGVFESRFELAIALLNDNEVVEITDAR
jgi:predicted nuclease of predicted toxin-antitoxin system